MVVLDLDTARLSFQGISSSKVLERNMEKMSKEGKKKKKR